MAQILRFLPWEALGIILRSITAKSTVSSCPLVYRPFKIELLYDESRSEVEVLLDNVEKVLIS